MPSRQRSVLLVVPRVKISFSEGKVFSQRKYRRTKTSYTLDHDEIPVQNK